jgi:16S rRNA (adenine1518-N6/adenine1519-N6)-dimethyltransferase
MNVVRPKKKLGQHFLKDQNIARKIVDSLGANVSDVLEIGPGMGVLTRFLLQRDDINLHVVEIDPESVQFLKVYFPELEERLFLKDFLKWDAEQLPDFFSIIGNFPYNISSQIFFRILQLRNRVPEVVGMVQKEVGERLTSGPGNKTYGILSVLLQAWYETDYLFTVPRQVFIPPPKVKSAVIRLKRNGLKSFPCNEKLFFEIVKTAFNQRRKMLRNSLKNLSPDLPERFAKKRPEQLAVADFIELTEIIENFEKK